MDRLAKVFLKKLKIYLQDQKYTQQLLLLLFYDLHTHLKQEWRYSDEEYKY